MSNHHSLVWIDGREARIFHFDAQSLGEAHALALQHHVRNKHDHEPRNDTHEHHFFGDVVRDVARDGQVLVVGPGHVKQAFVEYVRTHAHELAPRIVGVETVDHPTDGQLVSFARKHFGDPAPRVHAH